MFAQYLQSIQLMPIMEKMFTSMRKTKKDHVQPIYDYLMGADWKRGPAGTDEFGFNSFGGSFASATSSLAESVEIPNQKSIIYMLRRGVHFRDVPPVNERELAVTLLPSMKFPRGKIKPPKELLGPQAGSLSPMSHELDYLIANALRDPLPI